jgi:8-oxo-dGTP pyrophosphatase MutT (NUDIX family)
MSYAMKIREKVGHDRIFLPGVRAIILNSNNEILLQLRTDTGLWGLSAGAVELGETAMEALKREVYEETALEVLDAEPMGLYSGASQQFSFPNGDKVQPFAIAFIVRKWRGAPKPDGKEGSELRFWKLEELPENIVEIHKRTILDFTNYNGKFQLYG